MPSTSSLGDDEFVVIESDRTASGVGDIVLKSGGVERARIGADGTGSGWPNVLGGSIAALGAYAGLVPVSGQTLPPSSLAGHASNGTDIAQMSRCKMQIPASVQILRLVFANWMTDLNASAIREIAGFNDVTVSAAVETVGGLVFPLTVQGASSWTVKPGSQVITDPIDVDIAVADTFFWLRTFVQVASGGKWPGGRHVPAAVTGQLCVQYASAPVDQTNTTGALSTTGASSSGSGYAYSPAALLGPPSPLASAPKWVAVMGDSIAEGLNDSPDASSGFISAALLAANKRFVKIARGSERAQDWGVATRRAHRLSLCYGAGYAIVMLGTNDFSNRTLVQMQADLQLVWGLFATRGMKVYACTIPPRTTSTDSWATLVNQTPIAGGSVRTGFNDWIRTLPSPLTGYFEVADTVESSRNSGLWVVTGAASYATSDGVHPSAAAHVLMSAAINTGVLA